MKSEVEEKKIGEQMTDQMPPINSKERRSDAMRWDEGIEEQVIFDADLAGNNGILSAGEISIADTIEEGWQ